MVIPVLVLSYVKRETFLVPQGEGGEEEGKIANHLTNSATVLWLYSPSAPLLLLYSTIRNCNISGLFIVTFFSWTSS